MALSGYISLERPEALIVGAVLAWLFFRRLGHRNLWRLVMLALAIALLGSPLLVRTSKSIDIYLLADRSRSIDEASRRKQIELIDLASGLLRPGDRLGIVSFNDKPYIEQLPQTSTAIRAFETPFSEDASDLTAGLELILNEASSDRNARILVLSDGLYTGRDPARAAFMARQENIPIFYRNQERGEFYNLAVRDAQVPEKILAGEPYRVSFRVNATSAGPGRHRLWRDGRIVGADDSGGWRADNFQAGDNQIAFADSVRNPGIHSYKLEVEPADPKRETMIRDNSAERFVEVLGERPMLVVNNTGQPDNVARALTAGGLPVHVVSIGAFRMTIQQLTGYRGVVLNNVPVVGLTLEELRDLRRYVEQEGGGLLVAGGSRSFAAGGYYKTDLEPILPVSLEDRQQSKKISTAFSIVMDRSGSMAMSTPSGKTKISLAATAAAECIKLMSGADSLSVIAVDSAPHIIVPQQPVSAPESIIPTVLGIQSMGGGIFTYTGLVAGGSQIINADQLNKHLLLFADSNDAEEPGDYINLMQKYKEAGITVSVVGLGTEADSDAEFLKDVAKRGGGSIYFTQDAEQLTQFFTADTLTYTRNSFVPDPAPMAIRPGSFSLAPQNAWKNFSAGGYNLLFKRPEAELDIVTADEDQSPVLAHWQRGLGRVASLSLDTQGSFSANGQYPDIVLAAGRWIAGSEVFDSFQVKVGYEGREARVTMEVAEEEREKLGEAQAKFFTPDGQTISRPMHWESHNRLAASLPLDKTGLYRGVIEAGDKTFRIGPMSIPVSPEFINDRPADFGRRKLAQLASISGGAEAIELKQLFEVKRGARSIQPFVTPLLIAFLLLFLVDVAEARFGMLPAMHRGIAAATRRLRRRKPARTRAAGPAIAGETAHSKPIPESGSTDIEPETEASDEESPAPPPPPAPEMDYLSRSKAEAGRRLRGKRE